MKQGRTIVQLAQELERQRFIRKDYLSDTRNLGIMSPPGYN